MVGRRNWWWPRCGAHARSTNAPCQRKVVADEAGRPKSRCWSHGGAPGSGRQTPEGKRRAAEALSRTMKAFWRDWKAKGSPPITRGCIRVGQLKPAPRATAKPPRAQPKPTVLSAEDIEFAKRVGMRLPKSE
jgi:hypothetical protein